MKILVTADPMLPVPPVLYGGIERIIHFLVNELVHLGHDVHLVAHRDSKTNAQLIPYPGTNAFSKKHTIQNTFTVAMACARVKPDVVHSFGKLFYLFPLLPFQIPKIMSYQREPTLYGIKRAVSFSHSNSLIFTGCSKYIAEKIKPVAPAFTVYNGVEIHKYNFVENVSEDAPLVFLGRIEPVKGTHNAIEIAQKSGHKLIIAGNVSENYHKYFNDKIKPHLNDQIQYIGAVDDKQKNELLGNASALLMPIEWNEPFGIVMAEALACGTPVIGYPLGAVKEVIVYGENGYIAKDTNEAARYVNQLKKIDRKKCRTYAETNFNSKVIVREYEKLYNFLIKQ